MKVYDSNDLRNVAILGHSGCGKSNLIYALAYTTNISKKMPKLSDKVNMTYSIGLAPIEYKGIKYNFLDTPGYFDFVGEVISALRASDAAIIVIDATNPIQVGTEKSLELTENMPKIMFINKIDNEKARYKDAIDMLREKYDKKIVPMIIPEYKDKQFVKLHNILDNLQEAYDGDFEQQVLAIKEGLMELVAESDDAYLDKYFSGEEFTEEKLNYIIENIDKHNVKRDLSILGGEPLCDENVEGVLQVCKIFKEKYPEKKIYIWTGYTWENFNELQREVLKYIDVLVDGKFIYNKKKIGLKFRGSYNQRIIDVKESLQRNEVILKNEYMEKRLELVK